MVYSNYIHIRKSRERRISENTFLEDGGEAFL
jgi:hypothetical protein